jgi:hypothetical protein
METGDLAVTGSLLLYRLYDVAWEIDLQRIQDRVRESRRLSLDKRLSSKAFEFANPPVTLRLKGLEKTINGRPYGINAYAKAYDYGVLGIIFDIPVAGARIAEMEALAGSLRKDDPMGQDFLRARDGLVSDLGDAMSAVNMSRFEEDYAVYLITGTSPPLTAEQFIEAYDIGRLLLYEEGESPPGKAVVSELLSNRFSYSDGDMVVLNWDNALVIEPTGSRDIPDLLEFANAQLLELRFYDNLLDRELDSIYERISSRAPASIWKVKRYEELAARVMRTVTELTDITEKVDNSLKVTEDVYYARVYTSALRLFRVQQWEDSIRKKIDIASRVYDMLYREIANKRTELLELIIVILIALEIVLFIALSV